jgi:DNA-binding transcriptional LysR family regulator
MQKDPSRLPPLDLLVSFDAAARHLSFTKAGAERFLTQSAISRQIKALEDDLGVVLFRRRHRGLDLTDDGRRLREAVRDVIDGLRGTIEQIRAPSRREVLALTTTPGLASLWLIPRLEAFVSEHPGIDVRIDASLAKRNLSTDGFDLAIRYASADSRLGTPLFHETVQPVSAPALARDRARPLKTPADLRHHTLLDVEVRMGPDVLLEWDLWTKAMGVDALRAARTVTLTSYDAAIAAAVAGQGVALGRRPLIDDLLKRRQLVVLFGDELSTRRAYFLVIEPRAADRPSVRALANWLLEQVGSAPARSRSMPSSMATAGSR